MFFTVFSIHLYVTIVLSSSAKNPCANPLGIHRPKLFLSDIFKAICLPKLKDFILISTISEYSPVLLVHILIVHEVCVGSGSLITFFRN